LRFTLLIALLAMPALTQHSTETEPITALERAIAADPENLRTATDYRQLLIPRREFDRSIDLFEKLAKRKGSGPNIHISLALAYVDKVPTSGDIRRLYLGRDAMNELTKAIASQPTVLAYGMRGLINLYYNNFVFHRIPRGIADLEVALTLVTATTPPPLVAYVYRALGDGHWRIDERAKARGVWATGAAAVPGDAELQRRVGGNDDAVDRIVVEALNPSTRADTSLRGVVP
jgi:tetratricopeptide (TPR) repeat protein